MVLDFCDKEAHSAKEILDYLDVSYQSKNIHRYILVLVEQGRLVPEDIRVSSTKERRGAATQRRYKKIAGSARLYRAIIVRAECRNG